MLPSHRFYVERYYLWLAYYQESARHFGLYGSTHWIDTYEHRPIGKCSTQVESLRPKHKYIYIAYRKWIRTLLWSNTFTIDEYISHTHIYIYMESIIAVKTDQCACELLEFGTSHINQSAPLFPLDAHLNIHAHTKGLLRSMIYGRKNGCTRRAQISYCHCLCAPEIVMRASKSQSHVFNIEIHVCI